MVITLFFRTCVCMCVRGFNLWIGRYLKNIDATSTEMKQQVLSLIDIFKKQCVRIICDPKPEEGSAVESFLEELREVPQFHFA